MSLQRELGVSDAMMMGLGSIIGTGVFVSIGIAAGIAGPAVVVAVAISAAVATCNALNSAQLAANHPVSGGTYEYGYRYLKPWLGFAAGWMFLCAKTASAATAALGFAGYLLNFLAQENRWQIPLAICTVVILTAIVVSGIRLSNRVNIVIVSITLAALTTFIIAGLPSVSTDRLMMHFQPKPLLHASALMFVAYTGYGRIATLSEEVVEPHRTIPKSIVLTLVISMVVYIAVAIVAVGAAGADRLYAETVKNAAPLEIVSRDFTWRVHWLVSLGAMTAMIGVLLNLLLGLSRVTLAMGRRGDLPTFFANVTLSVVAVGLFVAGLVAIGNIKTTWTFSAFTVLIYYAVTNLAALRLAASERRYGKGWAWVGLIACLALAFAIEWQIWSIGLGLLAVGFLWHWFRTAMGYCMVR